MSPTQEFAFDLTLCEVGPVEIVVEVSVLYGLRYGSRVWDLQSIKYEGQEIPDRLWVALLMGSRNISDEDGAHEWLDDEVTWRIADSLGD